MMFKQETREEAIARLVIEYSKVDVERNELYEDSLYEEMESIGVLEEVIGQIPDLNF